MSVTESPERLLVVQVARIGDTLLVTPALRALKAAFPGSRLTVLAHPARRELLRGLTYIDRLGAITPQTAWLRGRWPSPERFDYALVYGHDAPLVRYAARVAERVVAFASRDARLNTLLWKAVPPPAGPVHAVEERLLLPAALGVTTTDRRLDYRVLPPEAAAADAWLARHLPAQPRPLVGFQLASFPTKAYRDWPIESFAALGRRLLESYPSAHLLLLGGQESRARAAALARALGPRAVPLAGRFALRMTAALMSRLDLYVGVDTGPTHLAGALRIPVVALYHCRHRGRYLAPLEHNRVHVIEHPASDADCTSATPMSAIDVQRVWEAAQALLEPH